MCCIDIYLHNDSLVNSAARLLRAVPPITWLQAANCDAQHKIRLIFQPQMNRFSRAKKSSPKGNLFSSESIVSPKPDTL
jgi:hypothetical protein